MYVWVSVKLYVCLHVFVWVLVYVWVCVIRHIEWCSNCFTKRASLSRAPPASMSAGCELFLFFFIKEKKTVFLSFSHSVSCSLACIFSSSHSRSSRFFFGFPSDQYRQFPLQKKIYQFVPLSTDTASDADQDDRSPVRFVTLPPLSLCLAQRRPRH